jgi:hypothetical protein
MKSEDRKDAGLFFDGSGDGNSIPNTITSSQGTTKRFSDIIESDIDVVHGRAARNQPSFIFPY